MIVHPRYHNSPEYTEPEIYGLAKYNLHYHEFVRVSNLFFYSFGLGELVQIKSLCGDNLFNNSESSRVAAITKDSIVLSDSFNETTNKTKVIANNSNRNQYHRFQVEKDDHKLSDVDREGYIHSDVLNEMLQKQQVVPLDLETADTYSFTRAEDWLLDYFSIIPHVNFEAFKGTKENIFREKLRSNEPSTLIPFLAEEILTIKFADKLKATLSISFYDRI